MLCVDFRQASDSVQSVKLYEAMQDMGIPLKLMKLKKMAMTQKPKLRMRTSYVNHLHLTSELSKVIGCWPPSVLLRYSMPVSYTHLDVYKRQVQGTVIKLVALTHIYMLKKIF